MFTRGLTASKLFCSHLFAVLVHGPHTGALSGMPASHRTLWARSGRPVRPLKDANTNSLILCGDQDFEDSSNGDVVTDLVHRRGPFQ